LPGVLYYSSQQILGLDEFKLLNGLSGELTAALAEIALLQAFRTAVILARSHYLVAATVRASSVLSSHHPPFGYMPRNIIGIYQFVKMVRENFLRLGLEKDKVETAYL
jgi:hypothetical protein